jgi:hypothetical protein
MRYSSCRACKGKWNWLRTLRATGVVGADTEVFFLLGPLAASRDGQLMTVFVSLSATAASEGSGEAGCSRCKLVRALPGSNQPHALHR